MHDAYSAQEILATYSQQTQAKMTYEKLCVIFGNLFLLRLKVNSTLKAGQVITLSHPQV